MNKIYLDNNSTTQIDPKVLESMLPYFTEKFGNPSSKTHAYGWEANAAIDIAKEKISKLINCNYENIIFTSGATESINLAMKGFYSFNKNNEKFHIITSSFEHKANLDVCKMLESYKMVSISYVKPNSKGIIKIGDIKKAITKNTKLISIMHVNNEIGTIQPIENIGKLCKEYNIAFHVDGAQSLGKINIDIKKMNIDFLSLSAHKIYGPKGIGALYINRNKIKIFPLILGGNNENHYRAGTLPTPLIVGFGKACEIATNRIEYDDKKISKLSNLLINKLIDDFPKAKINGCLKNRIAGNINISFPFLNGESIIRAMPKIAISSGSACNSSKTKPSHVLMQIGLSKLDANTTLRIGIGRFNNESDIDIAYQSIKNAIKK